MIEYLYDTVFELEDEDFHTRWLTGVIERAGCEAGELCYTFCSDEQLLKLNVEYLDHDTYTDIISFDYCEDYIVSGEMFISVDRVAENARALGETFADELDRVMVHGILHYLGHKDKTEADAAEMRAAEERALALRGEYVQEK